MSDDEMRAKIIELKKELAAIPEIPDEPPKTMADQIGEVAAEIRGFGERRAKLTGSDVDSFERARFQLTKDRLQRQLEKLQRLAESGDAVIK